MLPERVSHREEFVNSAQETGWLQDMTWKRRLLRPGPFGSGKWNAPVWGFDGDDFAVHQRLVEARFVDLKD